MPPAWMWVVDNELADFFEEVDRKRKDKFGSGASEDEESSMMSNELARGRNKR